ncbi:MAG: alpha/beta hydrolase [Actinobacteria bacterium]|nr:alpha/beta hydrolase [Actinomycetota bacterium]
MEEVTSKDGTTIAFDRSGEGPSIVIVGGALSDRSGAAAVASHLARRFTVIAYDRRGRGDSGDTAPYAVDREVEDIEALIVEVGGRAAVVGHSSGAVLALEAARSYPDRITKLALYEPPLIVDDSRVPLPEDFVTRIDALISEGRPGDAVAYFLTTGPGMPAEVVAGMRQEPVWSSFESIARTLAYDGTIVRDATGGSPAPLRRWASVGVTTLVMDGGASPDWIRNAALALTEVLPDAQRRTLEGQDHGPDPKLLAPALEAFFAA